LGTASDDGGEEVEERRKGSERRVLLVGCWERE
jgi:hypothetical protein